MKRKGSRGESFGNLWILGVLILGVWGCAGPRTRTQRVSFPAPPLAKQIVRTAKSYLPEEEAHRPTPRDCSDFVRKVFAENGIQLPRATADMSLSGERVAYSSDLRMGDLVFFSGSRRNRIVGHVGIYVRNGIFIHLSKPEAGVSEESMYSDYYRRRYLTARRIILP